MTYSCRRRAGIALLLVVGVLGILAMLAVAFVTMAQLERKASRQRMHATKALLLARAGIEDALARLSAGQDASLPGTAFKGEDWNDNNSLDGLEIPAEVFGPGSLDAETCPARFALRPSFFVENPAAGGYPALLQGNVSRGYTGRLAGDAWAAGNTYALKVQDESAKINVNGGFLDTQNRDAASGDGFPDHRDPDVRVNPADPRDTGLGWNFQLARILNVLGQQPEIAPAVPNLGTRLVRNRPAGGYRTMAQVQAVAGTVQDLSPYLTLGSWSDTKVLHPNAYPSQAAATTLSDVKKQRSAPRLEEGGRPPVNLNAAPRPVLVALLQDLGGISWLDQRYPMAYTIDLTSASNVATALIAARPLRTWDAVGQAIDPLVNNGGFPWLPMGSQLARADLVKANLDPNTCLNKHLPDGLLFRLIDKSDLTTWSTEGSLGPTGRFRIESTGRLISRDGRVLAEATLAQTVEAFSLLRQTTQKDFIDGRPLDQCLALSTDPWVPTTGATAAWNTWTGVGLAAMTYPSPPGAVAAGEAADFDGAIGLATYELNPTGIPVPCLFLHHLDDDWKADVGGSTAFIPQPQNTLLRTDVRTSLWPDPALSWPQNEPNTLYPDGMHLQTGRGVAFRASGNLPAATTDMSNHGVISYWLKSVPSYGYSHGVSPIDVSCVRWAPPRTQALMTGRRVMEGWGLLVEKSAWANDFNYERRYVAKHGDWEQRLPGGRWHLVTASFDTDDPNINDSANLAVQSQLGPGNPPNPPPDNYVAYSGAFLAGGTEDLLPGGVLVLGAQRRDNGPLAVPAATDLQAGGGILDEFAVCDFTDNGIAANAVTGNANTWHLVQRFKDGRYYKGSDAWFESTVLDPGQGRPVRLLQASWTAWLPESPRLESLNNGVYNSLDICKNRPIDATLRYASVNVDLMLGATPLPLAPGGAIQRTLPPFRYKVRIDANPIDPATGASDRINQPVLESPWLDDITFAWQPMTGPRILTFERP